MDADQAKALREPFPPGAIGKLPKGGVMLDYVGHAATTDRLLSVDPEWTWEPFALDEFGLPAMDSAGNLWIKLTVCGVTRPGVGDGKTQKERIGDAIRNAAMRFGVALDLWAKEDLHAQSQGDRGDTNGRVPVSHPTRPARDRETGEQVTPAQLKKIGAAMGQHGLTDRAVALDYVEKAIGRRVETRNDLTKAEASLLINTLQMEPKPAPTAAPGMDVPGGTDPWQQEPPEELP